MWQDLFDEWELCYCFRVDRCLQAVDAKVTNVQKWQHLSNLLCSLQQGQHKLFEISTRLFHFRDAIPTLGI